MGEEGKRGVFLVFHEIEEYLDTTDLPYFISTPQT